MTIIDFEITTDMRERFFNKIKKKRRCWLWCAGDRFQFSKNFRTTPKRASILISNQTFDQNDIIINTCKNMKCVNPKHLKIGTNKELYLQNKEIYKNLPIGNKNKTLSPEHIAIMSKAHKGKTVSKKTREKISKSLMGFEHSKKTIKKFSKQRIGEKNAAAQLTEEDVKYIRKMKNKMTSFELGAEFSVTPQNIQRVWKRLSWKHI
jgi:hypothetical protein